MTASKYLIIEAASLEERKRHRILVEEALENANLSPAQRMELAAELDQALTDECFAQQAENEVEADEKKQKEKGGDGDSGDEGKGSQSGGGGSGGGMVGDTGEEEIVVDSSELELFQLLFFLANAELQQATADETPLAAATLLYNANEQTAHIHEPYTLDADGTQHSPADLLPSLEHHAVTMGAREMCVRVHPDAVDLFRKKFGYEPSGAVLARKGIPVQRMRKSLTGAQFVKYDVT